MSTGWYAYPPGNKSICHLWRIWKSSTPKCRLEGDIGKVPRTLPKTNIEPENRQRAPKGKLVVQPSIFRCENVSFMEGISLVCTVCLAIAEVNWIPNYVSWVSLCILQGMTIAPWHQKGNQEKSGPGTRWYQVWEKGVVFKCVGGILVEELGSWKSTVLEIEIPAIERYKINGHLI